MNRRYIFIIALSALGLLPHSAFSQTQAPIRGDVICRADTPSVAAAPLVTTSDAPESAPSIPTATVVRDIERDKKGFPKWSNFPAAPDNIPTSSDIKQRVSDIKAREDTLEQAVTGLKWDAIDPASYSSSVRARLNADLSQPVTKNNCGDIHQFALSTRARVALPPSPDR
ncbi:hypothetical protein Q1W73_13075 [Asticcacaulis sp. ZE23SCel15]|uniref:hypothetical protein n=1 Tax=Asticcacaulis sp. ZE23SCel15 TaxID=3059027 RepID=UPI00265E1BE6|nr:hypothetical protein [Asticcacaulis sp. ZE23SCel15]WKL56607.1 hypothetical protein Q1W73_13075 [Asticcacaulis sp. ZE23SCel15]